MLSRKPIGQKAGAVKYDVLTAIGTFALSRPKGQQVLMLRLMTLITARYNWVRDELAVGQREMARMWGVDERTVKREMAKLKAMGWLVVKRQGARGRVTQFGLDFERILKDTQPVWAAVGPDFEQRMEGQGTPPEDANKVVPLPVGQKFAPPTIDDANEWGIARGLIHAEDPASFAHWIAPLDRVERNGRRLVLRAPSRFHAHYVATHLLRHCLQAVRAVDSDIDDIVIQS